MAGSTTTSPKEATQLAILGVVRRAPALGTEIVSLVKHVVGRAWQPTSDVIAVNLAELRGRRLVEQADPGRDWDTTRYAITEEGRAVLHDLLRAPLPRSQTGLDSNAVALKVCFLDLLETREQLGQVADLLELYEAEIRHFREAVARCACEWTYVPGWIGLELARLTAERDWFRDLRRRLEGAETAPAGD